MLQPRSLLRLRQCMSPVAPIPPLLRSFTACGYVKQEDDSQEPSTFFVPQASNTRPTFRESPIKQSEHPEFGNKANGALPNMSIDNYGQYRTNVFPQTGKLSGRTVACDAGKMGQAISRLNRIIKENKILEEFRSRVERLPPSEVRRELRRKRHRIRFAQGVSRKVGMILRMKGKVY